MPLRYETEPVESMTCDYCGFGFVRAGYSHAYVHKGNDGIECINCNPLALPPFLKGMEQVVIQSAIERELIT